MIEKARAVAKRMRDKMVEQQRKAKEERRKRVDNDPGFGCDSVGTT